MTGKKKKIVAWVLACTIFLPFVLALFIIGTLGFIFSKLAVAYYNGLEWTMLTITGRSPESKKGNYGGSKK